VIKLHFLSKKQPETT